MRIDGGSDLEHRQVDFFDDRHRGLRGSAVAAEYDIGRTTRAFADILARCV